MRATRFAFVLCLAALASCSLPVIGGEDGEGSLELTVTDGIARTLLPPIDMVSANFEIAGTGPGGKTFSQSTTGTSITITKLVFGTWTVTVSAKNSAGTVIGRGTGTAAIVTGQQTALAVTVTPLSGTGTLDLHVTWTAADVQTASIDAQLLPSSGSAIPLAFTLASGSAACVKTGIAAGYYTLSLKLLDNGVLVMGAVEVVRIVSGQTTSGVFDFTQINRGVGSISLTISCTNSDPIPVTLSGQAATLAAGGSMTVTAAVPTAVGNVTYVWYLNGEAKATGSSASPSLTLGSTLSAGYYRLDVTAFTANGLRAGAATCSFAVL